MKADIVDIQGNQKSEIELPKVFASDYRPEIIRRAFLVTRSKKRQPYGTDKMAGKRTSARYWGSRDLPPDRKMMNREMSRLKRIFGDTAGGLLMRGRFVPQAVKGRRAHPPKVEKKWRQKINKKERLLAIKSAIAATISKELVVERGHRIGEIKLPIVVDDSLHTLKKTKDVVTFLEKIGLKKEMERAKKKKVRAGKGKMRGRKYKRKKSVLFVIGDSGEIIKSVKNVPGTDICLANNINVELLAPGSHAGRLTIYSESAIKKLGEIYG
jgi:large subunit ribosomal protein L4e